MGIKTPKLYLLLVCTAIHVCKQMGLDVSYIYAKKAVGATIFDVDIAKGECMHVHNSEKKDGWQGGGHGYQTGHWSITPICCQGKSQKHNKA